MYTNQSRERYNKGYDKTRYLMRISLEGKFYIAIVNVSLNLVC
jgi:hypothetical protein